MKPLLFGLVILGACLVLAERALARETASHLDDPAQVLAPDSVWTNALESRLSGFEVARGIRVLVRFESKSPSVEEDKVPGAFMSALAGRLGTVRRGVLVVYFADDPDWRIWIGDDLTATFAGKPGTVQEPTAAGAIHDVKEALVTAALAESAAAFAVLQQTAPADKPPTPAQHLRLQTDALLDALMTRFSPK